MGDSLHHDERVALEILGRDEPRRLSAAPLAADAEAAALAERVALEAAVAPEEVALDRLDGPRAPRQPGADEVAERPLADEADAGRVALGGDGQAALPRDRADRRLPQPADREQAGGQLLRGERMKEVALVLGLVRSAKEPAGRADPGVVAGRELLGAEPLRVLERDAELDLAVAEHVGVGRPARLELGQEAGEHALAVLRSEARLVQGDAELVADAAGVLEVRGGGAVAVLVLLPVRHEQRLDVVPVLLEEGGGDGRVDAARERYDDARHGASPAAAGSPGTADATWFRSESGWRTPRR
jgi:hypothetical protein